MHAAPDARRRGARTQTRTSITDVHHDRERRVPAVEPGHHVHLPEGRPAERAPDRRSSTGQLMGKLSDASPACSRSCGRTRCSRSAPARRTRTRASSRTRSPASIPRRSTRPPAKLMAKLAASTRASPTVSSGLLPQDAEPRDRHPPRPGARRTASRRRRILTLLRNAYSPELRLPDQAADGPVPGDPRGRGRRARASRRTSRCCTSSPTTASSLVPLKALVDVEADARPAVGEPHQPVHERDVQLQPDARRRHRRRDRLHRRRPRRRSCRRRCAPSFQGEALTFRNTVRDLTILMIAGRVRDVRDPGDPLRELPAPGHGALDAADRAGRRAADAAASSARRRRSTRTSACSC